MAGKIPIIGLPSPKGIPGDPGDPGYTGGWGSATGSAIGLTSGAFGVAAGPVAAILGAAVGAAADWLFGKATRKKPKAAIPVPPRPQFAATTPYKAPTSNLADPGAGPGMSMEPNVRFSAAQNLQKKLNQGMA